MTLPIDIVKSYNTALFTGLATGSTDGINEYLTDTTLCIESPVLPWGGKWVGPDGFAAMFGHSDGVDFEMDGEMQDEYWADGTTVFHRMSFDIVDSAKQKTTATSLELYKVEEDKISSIEVFFFDPTVFKTKVS